MLDVSRQTVSRWESGKSVPSSVQLSNLCKAFNIDANNLFAPRCRTYSRQCRTATRRRKRRRRKKKYSVAVDRGVTACAACSSCNNANRAGTFVFLSVRLKGNGDGTVTAVAQNEFTLGSTVMPVKLTLYRIDDGVRGINQNSNHKEN